MLRHLAHSLQRVLTLQPTTTTTTYNLTTTAILRRTLFEVEKTPGRIVSDADTSLAEIQEGDTDYIVPYRSEREKRTRPAAIINALSTRFRLTASDVKRLQNDEQVHRTYRCRSLLNTLETLCLAGVNKRNFLDNPTLLTQDKFRLDIKLELIQSIPLRDINDFVPFLRLTVPRLRKLMAHLIREADTVPHGNRVYFISEKLQTDPYECAKYLSKRLFTLEMPFEMFNQNLQHMIDYKVSPVNILKDLWAFRYMPKSVQLRLERAKRAQKYKIMPWMVRCPEPILQRSLKLATDEIAVLGDKTSVVEYVAERLQFDVRHTKAIMDKHPQVNTVRVPKIKEVLDYLLDEAGFTRFEVAQVPRILCHSLKTTRARLEELKSHGCRPTSLVIVCRSKREYQKFLLSWLQMKEKGYAPRNDMDNNTQQTTIAEKT